MNKIKLVIVFIITIYLPVKALAWGPAGHRISGQIAESYLDPKARGAIKNILEGESIAMASTYADEIKVYPEYRYLNSWHYIDFPPALTYPQMQVYLKHDTAADAYTKINFLMAELKKKNLAKDYKAFYLRMLIHLVEDVHQPMHTAHAGDKGGNTVDVFWLNKPTNMHAVWDADLIDYRGLSYLKYAQTINHTTASQRTSWQQETISKWLFESNQIAEKLYDEIRPGDKLGDKYEAAHIAIVNRQLLKAGVRLAGVLNELFR